MQQFTEEQQRQLQEKMKDMSPEQLKELQKQQCIFCRIAAGKMPAHKIYEDADCTAVLDINPAAKGHLLLFPKDHYALMPQVPEELQGHLLTTAKKLSRILLKTFRADGTNIFVANGPAAGQRSQHFLIHIIPRKGGDGIMRTEDKLVSQEMVSKVKTAVEGKLQELLGLKDGAVRKTAFGERQPEKKKTVTEEVSEVNNTAKEKKSMPKSAAKKTGAETGQKPAAKKKVETKEEVSLDDIAKLFK